MLDASELVKHAWDEATVATVATVAWCWVAMDILSCEMAGAIMAVHPTSHGHK